MGRFCVILWILLGCSCLAWADEEMKFENKSRINEVEVSPGKWVAIKKTDVYAVEEVGKNWSYNHIVGFAKGAAEAMLKGESTELIIPWNDQELLWKDSSIPVCLREKDGLLYLIAFDRSDMKKIRFRYYAQKDKGFKEIPAMEFPKEIASQNMWLKPQAHSTGMNGECICDIELALDLSPDNKYFVNTMTAGIWNQLMTGEEYSVAVNNVKNDVLQEFVEKYRPIKLTLIIKEFEQVIASYDKLDVILVAEGAHWVKGFRVIDKRYDQNKIIGDFSGKWVKQRWKGIDYTLLPYKNLNSYDSSTDGIEIQITTVAKSDDMKDVLYQSKILIDYTMDGVSIILKEPAKMP